MRQLKEKDILYLLYIEDVTQILAGAKVFLKFHASIGYWQVPLHPYSSKLTTFITPRGRFCFRRLPFGVTSSPEIFQKRMTNLLKDQGGATAIQDDIIVYGKSVEEHDARPQAVLKTTEKSGFKLNERKCEIGRTCIRGTILSVELL